MNANKSAYHARKLLEWQGEVSYCADLVRTRGNRSVPAALVDTYLAMERRQADREGFHEAGTALAKLETEWANRDRGQA